MAGYNKKMKPIKLKHAPFLPEEIRLLDIYQARDSIEYIYTVNRLLWSSKVNDCH